MEVILIKLDDDDDPQLIFESLNSTGLDLSEADKIRNYMLMSLAPEEQEKMYVNHWNPIEELTDYKPSAFVRDYLTMMQGKIGRIDRIYLIFKEYAEKNQLNRQDLLDKLHHFAKYYSRITNASFENERVNQKLKELLILDSSIANPYFMAFFEWADLQYLPVEERYNVLDIVENYWARRVICNLPSNAMNKVFATLHRDVLANIEKYMERTKGVAGEPKYVDVLRFVLLNKTGSSRLPEDDEVRIEFVTRQVYKMPIPSRTFILERMENQDSNERHDIVKELTEKNVTVEHIMPQTLSEKWKSALGEDYRRIHQQYLHTMANLTLTGYNSQYSNLDFKDKRDMQNGFKDSSYRLNNDLKTCEKWTEDEMIERQKRLLGVFFKLWKMPTTNFAPIRKNNETAGLDEEEFEFTGRKLQAFLFDDTVYSVPTWKDMLIQVCKLCYINHRYTVESLCAKNSHGFYINSTAAEGLEQFEDGLYVWSSNSTVSKLSIIRRLFDECEIPYSDLVFELAPITENETNG